MRKYGRILCRYKKYRHEGVWSLWSDQRNENFWVKFRVLRHGIFRAGLKFEKKISAQLVESFLPRAMAALRSHLFILIFDDYFDNENISIVTVDQLKLSKFIMIWSLKSFTNNAILWILLSIPKLEIFFDFFYFFGWLYNETYQELVMYIEVHIGAPLSRLVIMYIHM